jgi:hypothetical protein
MKLELTDRQAEALLSALNTFDDSYAGFEPNEILASTKMDLRLCEKITQKILTGGNDE